MFPGNSLDHFGINVFCNQSLQRRRVCHRIAKSSVQHIAFSGNVMSSGTRIYLFHLSVIVWTEKSEWRGQGARADPCDHAEFRPLTRRGPSHQQACSESPVRTAAGDGEVIVWSVVNRVELTLKIGNSKCFEHFRCESRPLITPEPCIRNTRNNCFQSVLGRQRLALWRTGTTRQNEQQRNSDPALYWLFEHREHLIPLDCHSIFPVEYTWANRRRELTR